MNFALWLQAIGVLLPVLIQAGESVAHLVEAIRAAPGLTPEQQQALVDALRVDLKAESARVDAVPVFVPST